MQIVKSRCKIVLRPYKALFMGEIFLYLAMLCIVIFEYLTNSSISSIDVYLFAFLNAKANENLRSGGLFLFDRYSFECSPAIYVRTTR